MSFDPYFNPYPSKRTLVYAQKGLVAASHPLAVEAGLHTLREGGNAVDAALAVAAALCVVDPSMNGIGGDCFVIVNMNKQRFGLNASGHSPLLLTPNAVREKGHSTVPLLGWLPVTVPGAPAGWAAMSKRFGRLSLEKAFAPAVALSEGYPLSPGNASALNGATRRIEGGNLPELSPWLAAFNPSRHAFRPGERFCVPEMGRTLSAIAKSGAEDFYRGEIAAQMDRHARETGGLLRAEDLAAYQPKWVTPISVPYRGYEVMELPPNGQGLTALLALNILSGFSLDGRDSVETLHLQMEAVKLAFADAQHYVADPESMRVSVAELLSPAYAAKRRALITDRAQTYGPGAPSGSDTVYFCCADGEGNSVSWIQSLFYAFGSGVTVPGTGITFQNRGACFSMDEGHANLVGPRKFPYHTIIPGFLLRDGEPLGPFGCVGGYMQPQSHVQILSGLIDCGLNPQAAIDAPRFSWEGGLSVEMEPGYNPAVIQALQRRGHRITVHYDKVFGRAQMILRDQGGAWCGASEPRADGCALGL